MTASIHVVEKTLAGNLPSVKDMEQATERMTQAGAVPTRAGAPAVNLVAANGTAPTVEEQKAHAARVAAFQPGQKTQGPKKAQPGTEFTGPKDAPSEGELIAKLDLLAKQNNDNPNAPVFVELVNKYGQSPPEKIPGADNYTKLLEVYKAANDETRRKIATDVTNKTNPAGALPTKP